MNWFEIIAYTNIGICVLLIILIVISIIKMFNNDNETRNSILMSNYEIERKLKEISNKLDNKN